MGAGGVVQGLGVALNGHRGGQRLFGVGLVPGVLGDGGAVEGLVDGFEVDAGGSCGTAVEDVDGDESCLGDEDGDLLGVHRPEEHEAAGGLTRLERQVVVVVLDLVLHAGGG